MNRRIRELAEQALDRDSFIWACASADDELAEFAKLIIYECSEVASSWDGDQRVGTTIEKHFGIHWEEKNT